MPPAPSGAFSSSAPAPPTRLTLVVGGNNAARELAIRDRLLSLPPGASSAIVLEGLPDGQAILTPSDHVSIQRIAPACLCCTGNLVLRVTLNRILRFRPESLYIGMATSDHLDQLRSWLQSPPYDQLLELTPDLVAT
jgi:hypothetical protein